MNETINQLVLQSLATKLAKSELESAQNEAFYQLATSELKAMNEVLEYDPALKELFEETKVKMQKGGREHDTNLRISKCPILSAT